MFSCAYPGCLAKINFNIDFMPCNTAFENQDGEQYSVMSATFLGLFGIGFVLGHRLCYDA